MSNHSAIKPLDGGPTFQIRHRVFRAAWTIVWVLLGRWSPVPMHRWRLFLLRMFGARLHSTCKVYPSASVWYPPNLMMDAYSCLGPEVNCYCMDQVTLGKYALVSQGAFLCGGTHDVDDPDFELKTRPISIGANAWIAAESFVGPAVTVGEGAVLGARAVTFRDLEPWLIYVGNPARKIRERNGGVRKVSPNLIDKE